MSDYINDVFGETGLLAQHILGYKPRPGQVDLARFVDKSIVNLTHLLAEAPTGTGKTLAYSVPASYHASIAFDRARASGVSVEEAKRIRAKHRVVIATANISLQEQLVRKDLPFLSKILPWKFKFALLKGWRNYLCLNKIEEGAKGVPDIGDLPEIARVNAWAQGTETGDRSELSFEPTSRVWDRFSISTDDCGGDDCPQFDRCHAERAYSEAAASEIIVVNYHLLFAHYRVLMLTQGNASLLPPFGVVIMDEGHKAADVARDFFGWQITEGSIQYAGKLLEDATPLVLEGRRFFSDLETYFRGGKYKIRLREPHAIDSEKIVAALHDASSEYGCEIDALIRVAGDPENMPKSARVQYKKLCRRADRCDELANQINSAMTLLDPNVYFIEEENRRIVLKKRLVNVSEALRACLFHEGSSVSVTSATLAANQSFKFVAGEMGVDDPKTLIARSPFSLREQALLVIPQGLPDPKTREFDQAIPALCAKVIMLAHGRTLGLFTSYRNLNAAYDKACETGYRILKQGDMPRTALIEAFRKDVNSVLLGTESFWAGMDVPGESLSCVFIDRLPFTHVEDPVLDAISAADPKAFWNYSVPKAIIAFKQGFGRLIRSIDDRGVVVLADSRVVTKGYGAEFLNSLPGVRLSRNLEDVGVFLDRTPIGIAQQITQPVSPRSLFDRA